MMMTMRGLDDKVTSDEGMEKFEFRRLYGMIGLMDTDNIGVLDLQVKFLHGRGVVVVMVFCGHLEENFPAIRTWSTLVMVLVVGDV